MRQKLGLFNEEPEDKALIDGYLDLLFKYRADYTNAFLALTFDKLHQMPFSPRARIPRVGQGLGSKKNRAAGNQSRITRLNAPQQPSHHTEKPQSRGPLLTPQSIKGILAYSSS